MPQLRRGVPRTSSRPAFSGPEIDHRVSAARSSPQTRAARPRKHQTPPAHVLSFIPFVPPPPRHPAPLDRSASRSTRSHAARTAEGRARGYLPGEGLAHLSRSARIHRSRATARGVETSREARIKPPRSVGLIVFVRRGDNRRAHRSAASSPRRDVERLVNNAYFNYVVLPSPRSHYTAADRRTPLPGARRFTPFFPFRSDPGAKAETIVTLSPSSAPRALRQRVEPDPRLDAFRVWTALRSRRACVDIPAFPRVRDKRFAAPRGFAVPSSSDARHPGGSRRSHARTVPAVSDSGIVRRLYFGRRQPGRGPFADPNPTPHTP